ncbi:VOC family protein [Cupriavidus cauae]|uniref:VOC family protein n=1 Tax=Cupriavidus cauae TaxID=2608999 RepID=UPI002243C156|nr:VOC family protein [Cupriavidus cauae]UZN52461.1 VOC family protein [Cupriavidus cauae]
MTATTMGIDHIGLTVANLEASTRFFTECLGWRVFGSNPAYPAAYVTDGTAKITLWQVADATAFAAFDRKNAVGLHHLALKVPDRSSLGGLFERVRAYPGVEVEFAPELSGNGPKWHAMVMEPGGTRLELSFDPR